MNTPSVPPVEIVDDTMPLATVEVLRFTHIERTYLIEFVEAGIASPQGANVEEWQFVQRDVRRIRAAHRLITQLEVNTQGAALILDLIDERNSLLQHLRALKSFVESR